MAFRCDGVSRFVHSLRLLRSKFRLDTAKVYACKEKRQAQVMEQNPQKQIPALNDLNANQTWTTILEI